MISAAMLPLFLFANAEAGNVCTADTPDVVKDGRDDAEFVEVDEGVFLTLEALDDGLEYSREAPPGIDESAEGETARRGAYSCRRYNWDSEYDSTSNGTLFGGDPNWGGHVSAYSVFINSGGFFYDVDSVSFNAHTQTPSAVSSNLTSAAIYVNGSYVGYVANYASNSNFTWVYGYLTTSCRWGSLSIEMQHYHYAWNNPETLYIGDRVATRVPCCN